MRESINPPVGNYTVKIRWEQTQCLQKMFILWGFHDITSSKWVGLLWKRSLSSRQVSNLRETHLRIYLERVDEFRYMLLAGTSAALIGCYLKQTKREGRDYSGSTRSIGDTIFLTGESFTFSQVDEWFWLLRTKKCFMAHFEFTHSKFTHSLYICDLRYGNIERDTESSKENPQLSPTCISLINLISFVYYFSPSISCLLKSV